jgi:hypothetical protein
MSSQIDIIKAANRKESRRVKVVIPVDDQTVTFYIAAKDTYLVWADQRARFLAEKKKASRETEDKDAADSIATSVSSSALLREILPRYLRNEDGTPAYSNNDELQEIIDLISSDGSALFAISSAWVEMTKAVTAAGKKAKN